MIAPGARVHLRQAFKCCPWAGAVSAQIHAYLEQNGYRLVASPDEADVHVVHTCGSDARQAARTFDALDDIRARTPDAAVVVTGCLVSIEPDAVRAALAPFRAAARFDPRHLDGLDGVFHPERVAFGAVHPELRPEYAGSDFGDGWAHVVASTGCLGTCSFCAIRRATGRPKSRSIPEILADVERAVDAGTRDVLLISTDLSAWGTDKGATVVELCRALVEHPGDFLVSGESFEPTLFLRHFDALLPLLASGRFGFVALPIQSGSGRVLRRMDRVYDPADVLAAVARLKAAAPDLLVRTDLLYGFADETEAEFEASLVASRAFDLPSFNAYQPRPGTAPAELPEAVVLARRDRAFAELRERARAGVPTLRRWGRRVAERADERPPWERAEGRAWIEDQARRWAGVLARRGAVALEEGWALVAAVAGDDAVVLALRGPSGEPLEVGLGHPDWPRPAMARSDRYALWVRADAFSPTAAQDRALKRLARALGA